MNKAIVIALIVSCVFARLAQMDEQSKEKAFINFTKTYGKKYGSTEERLARFSTFKANLNRIDIFNKQDPTATYGITQFADITQEEFEAQYNGYKQELRAHSAKTTITAAVMDTPASIDWVALGAVTGVKNQGQCGSCWAFSTTGSMEGAYQIKNKKLLSFSEQQLVDCDTKEDQGCNGGLMDNAFTYLETNKLETEADYKYTGVSGACKYNASAGVVSTKTFTDVDSDETVIASTLATVGPLSVAINANPLQFYTGGVFNPALCNPKKLDHGVLLVGFGTEGTTDFWKVKNSWGAAWGEKGYFRIVRGQGKCGINTAVSYPTLL